MQRIVNCKLDINRSIGGKEEKTVVEGKGYYKDENDEIVVFFSCEDIKYKYVYKNEELTIFCDDSKYVFKMNVERVGEIKSGDYIFRITTLASNIEVNDNHIIVNYTLYQNKELIGTYYSKLSFN